MPKVLVIGGGGAAGMMAAITAKRKGANVILLERNNRVGKKIQPLAMEDVIIPM